MSAFTEANRKAFNDLSATYNTKPWQHALSTQVSNALTARKSWLGATWTDTLPSSSKRQIRLLDYASGTGAITRALGPWVHATKAIDVSENMVAAYNEAAESSGLEARAVVGDLICEELEAGERFQGPEWWGFDVAVVGLGFHHFEEPERATRRLVERLRPGTGVLVIVDFLPFESGGQGHGGGKEGDMGDMQRTIKHSGFSGEQMRKLFEGNGLEDFGFDVLDEPAVMWIKEQERHRRIFIAKGRRVPTAWGKLANWFGSVQDGVGEQMKI